MGNDILSVVLKAEKDAENMIENAKEEKQKIIEKAKLDAQEIMKKAKADCENALKAAQKKAYNDAQTDISLLEDELQKEIENERAKFEKNKNDAVKAVMRKVVGENVCC